MIYKLAHRYRGSREPFEDLCQEGALGLLRAIDLFSPDRGARFSSYAMLKIDGALRHYIRDYAHPVRIPGWVQELSLRIRREQLRCVQRTGQSAPPSAIAAKLGIDEERVVSFLSNPTLRRIGSLEDLQMGDDSPEGWDGDFRAVVSESESRVPLEERLDLLQAMGKLDRRERDVVCLYCLEQRTFREISADLQLEYDKARKIFSRAMVKLRQRMKEPSLPHETGAG